MSLTRWITERLVPAGALRWGRLTRSATLCNDCAWHAGTIPWGTWWRICAECKATIDRHAATLGQMVTEDAR